MVPQRLVKNLELDGRYMINFRFLDGSLFDTRFALRQLRKTPGFTVTAILTLALGIGASTAMFVVIYGVLLRPLPFPNAHRLYQPIGIDKLGNEDESAPYEAIERWRSSVGKSAEIALITSPMSVLDTPSGARQINDVESSINLLTTLDVQPILGRGFVSGEAAAGSSHVVLLSYGIWHDSFSADPHVLGRSVYIGGTPFVVIGVMPPGFLYPVYKEQSQVWTPLEENRLRSTSASNPYDRFNPIIRVQDGVDPSSVEAALSSAQRQVAKAAAASEVSAVRIRLTPLRDTVVGAVRPALKALELAVALVWLISCSNVAGLLLARIASRRTEIAVRGALGAHRMRIARQFLTESFLLSLAGALVGVTLALVMLHVAQRIIQRSLPLPLSFSLDWPLMAAFLGFSLLTALVFGVFPAVIAAHVGYAGGLKHRSHTSGSDRSQSRLRSLLVICEVAMSLTLLVAAGLMLRTLHSLRSVPLGFRTDHIVLTNVTLPGHLYKDRNVATAAWQPLLERVQHLPGVGAAALSTVFPIGHPIEWLTLIYKTSWSKGNGEADVRAASPELLQVLGIRLLQGRFITANDIDGTVPVAVVNQTFVNRYLGGRDGIGKQIRFGRVPSTATVVGVLEDVRQDAVSTPSSAELYLSMAQMKPGAALYLPMVGESMQLGVRMQNDPDGMISALSRAIHDENAQLIIGRVSTMNQLVEDSIGTQRLMGGLVLTFGGLALMITVVGLYGLLTYTVAQRTHEIGIRMALGAHRGQVTGMIMRQSLTLLLTGVAVGIAASFWTNQLLKSFLYGVSSRDPWMLVPGPLILLAFGIIAAILPARRAASVNPMQALRSDT